ncbi:MAG: hypothetical protein CVV48_06725 [Spirochaetae bacterium HGW-Spirochaetae-4]|nr:MAG: hypothetical protein CVV52_11590 [Spirochaetae bacterium HGW-Spirochaetae-8]PKL21679.1 MAG: hypothetical protein CVV48_06725 [Spirochaetae bacterium HGW-Spirochaetae-4]
MTMRFSMWLSGRLLVPKGESKYARLRLVRSAALIAIVMIPLVLALIFMDGMMNGITDKYILLQDGHIQLHVEDPLFDSQYDVSAIDPRLESADYVVSGYGIVYSRDTTAEVRIKGVDISYFNENRMTQLEFTGEPLKKEGSLAAVMLSTTIAQKLGVEVGQRVAFMVVPDSSSSVVRPVLANVTALYDSGYHELDSSLLFMNRDDAMRYFPKDRNAYTELLVSRDHVDDLGAIVATLESAMDKNFPYATWDEFNGTVYQNFITSRQVILLVFMMILLVAGVYVSSIAQEMIQDSMQSIALFKTLGATNSNLSWAYFCSVMVVTSIGLVAGVSLGLLIGSQIGVLLHWLGNSGLAGLQYYLLDFRIVISWRDILAISFSMLVISSVTVRLSLGRIRRISPLEMLQQD